MQTKTLRSGAPFLAAGAAVLAYALIVGLGGVSDYLLAAGVGLIAYAVGRRTFPDRTVQAAPHSGDKQTDELIAEARERLAQIRQANARIAEPELSAQIDDIESACAELLARLEEQPSMLSSLRTFLRYYLPTTLRLLQARAALEGDTDSGKGAQLAARIREAMAQIQSALHKQLDAVNEYRFIDLESEMDALAAMLKSDGLTGDGLAGDGLAGDGLPDAPQAAAPAGEDDPFAALFKRGDK